MTNHPRDSRHRRGRGSRLVGAATALLLVSATVACGLGPPSGVRVDRRLVGTLDDEPDVRRLPSGPRAGENPDAVVRGFLNAAAAAPEAGHALARSFLAPDARWDDAAGAVYDPSTLTIRPLGGGPRSGSGVALRLQALRLATVARDGAYLPAAGRLDVVVRLGLVGRDWRIDSPPAGLWLTERDLVRGYRPVSRYLLAADADVLVPEPLYLTGSRTTLAGTATRALFAGPGAWLDPAVRTEAPPALTPLGSVVVGDGTAVVDLDRSAFDVPAPVRPLLVGQLRATLGTVPGVDQVRVLAEGRTYQDREPVGAAEVPDALRPASKGPTFAIGPDGSLLRVQTPTPGEPPAAVSRISGVAPRLVAAVADPGGSGSVAALQQDRKGSRLLLGPATDLRPAFVPPGPLVGPSWLPGRGVVLVAPSGPRGSTPRLLLVSPVGVVTPLALPSIGLLGVPRELAVSPDGSRLLLRTGSADPARSAAGQPSTLWMARLGTRDGRPWADGWTAVTTGLDEVALPSWASSTQIVLTGRRGAGARALWRTSIDRLADPERIPTDGLPAVPAAVSATGGRILVVAGGGLWRWDGDRWTGLGPARSVAQPH